MMPRARRSFTGPIGLKASRLASRLTPCGASLPMRTEGVRPTVSRMLSYRLVMESSPSFAAPAAAAGHGQGVWLRVQAGGSLLHHGPLPRGGNVSIETVG